MRLRLEDDPVGEDLQTVGAERRPGRGDVDDEIGGARGGGALGRAEAFDDAVVGDAVAGEEAPRQVDIFGRDGQPAAVPRPEVGGDVVEVLHVGDVDPRLGHRDHDVASAEAERQDEIDLRLPVADRLLDLVAPGDAEMDGAGADLAGDLGRRQVGDLDVRPGPRSVPR